jgi:glycosyltransferase involved in cell wall biosynthesis
MELGSLLSHERCNVFYNPGQYAPLYSPCPVVATALDVAWRYYPEYFPLAKRVAFDILTVHACHRADRIIAISESTRADLVRMFNCRPEKIVVAYPGVDHSVFRPTASDDEQTLKKYGIRKGNYILFLGTLQKRKNVIRLVKAFGRLKQNDTTLVLAGGQGWYYNEIAEAVAECPRQDDIIETGYIQAEERPAFYRNATCLAYISLYEGFGFPVAEAMACGCPPVVSRVSSLPEISGDVGWQVDPLNEEEIAAALEQAIATGMDPDLRARAAQRARRFNWAESAGVVHDVLLEANR